MAKFTFVFYGFLVFDNMLTTFFISYRIFLLLQRILRIQRMKFLMPSHKEIFIQFNYQEATTKRCFYRGHLEIHHRDLCISIVTGIDIGIGIAEKLFCLQNFLFQKKQNIYVLSCAQLWYQYHFAANAYFSTISCSSIERRPLVFQKKEI